MNTKLLSWQERRTDARAQRHLSGARSFSVFTFSSSYSWKAQLTCVVENGRNSERALFDRMGNVSASTQPEPPRGGSALLSFKPPSCLSQLLQLLWSHVRPSDRRWPSWVPNPVEGRLGGWEHVKVAAFHTLLSERPLRTEFCFLCTCKQLFTLASLSCGDETHLLHLPPHRPTLGNKNLPVQQSRLSLISKAINYSLSPTGTDQDTLFLWHRRLKMDF